MGQLERYGLYVLVLVIFLILGVAIWGDPAQAAPPQNAPINQQLANAGNGGGGGGAANPEDDIEQRRRSISEALEGHFELNDLDDFVDPPSAGGNDGPNLGGESAPPATGTDPQPTPSPDEPKPVAEPRTYVVAKGDTLESIARRELGKKSQWRRIQAANPGINPKKLRIGTKLVLPPRRVAGSGSATTPSTSSERVHEVKKGDSPASIAKLYYGNEKFAQSIMDANDIRDPRKLRLGAKLKIPSQPK